MAEILSIRSKIEVNKAKRICKDYADKVAAMDKIALLDAMVSYQLDVESMESKPLENILQGIILFTRLKETAETQELKETTEFYLDLLKVELETYERVYEEQLSNNRILS